MSRIVTTESDLARADRLLDAIAKKDRKALGALLAEAREETLQCASVRVEREYEVALRKQPGLPFYEETKR